MILGVPWLSKENPHIDWTQAIVVMKKGQEWISLPLAKSQQQDPIHLATEVSATRLDKMFKRKEVERAFLGIIRLVKEDPEGMETTEESTMTQKPKWDQALPSPIRAVLEEFDDVFPLDLPLGLPPMRQGHEFKIDLEDDVPPGPSPSIQDAPARAGRGKESN